jgi:hypothetical protein
MAMRNAEISITGVSPLLMNNPQTVDRFNGFAKRMAAINAKKTRRTDDDYLELRDLEMESKTYFDKNGVGIYVPSSWLSEAIATAAFRVAKISRADIRGALFTTEEKIPLKFRDMDKVKAITDIIKNEAFRIVLNLPQGQTRLAKAFPIFHQWSFKTSVEFDDKIIDPDSVTRIVEHTAKYGGFGDFRPKFGRAAAEVKHV